MHNNNGRSGCFIRLSTVKSVFESTIENAYLVRMEKVFWLSQAERIRQMNTRFNLQFLVLLFACIVLSGCKHDKGIESHQAPRSFRMGFSGIPPRNDQVQAIQAIDMWSLRADAAIMSFEIPWGPLLAGITPETEVTVAELPLANYYRSKGHKLWIYLDPSNGLNRGGESDSLVSHGRSITEPEIQQIYRRYCVVIDSIIKPDHLGLGLETNLIRGASTPELYAAIRQVINDAAADVRLVDSTVPLSVSVQVDYAWGNLDQSGFHGIDTDFVDFPFIEELGLSSYPYLAGFTDPDSLPADYYSRLIDGRTLPVFVTEGGWTSESLGSILSTPEIQRRYIDRQITLLESVHASGVFQLTFTDLDLNSIGLPPGSSLVYFAYLGLVDIDLNPKPALAAWDAAFRRPRSGD